MYFPRKHGFRIGKFRESDGARNKTLALRKGMEIVVLVTYEPPCLLSQGHFSNSHSHFDPQAFKRPTVARLHSMGKIVAYMHMPFPGNHLTFLHHNNWVYDLDEVGGADLIIECFFQVWTEIGLAPNFTSDTPDIGTALDFLAEAPVTRARRAARNEAPSLHEDGAMASTKNERNAVITVSVMASNHADGDVNLSAAWTSFPRGLPCGYCIDNHGLSNAPRSQVLLAR
jgi:hypothetical protein